MATVSDPPNEPETNPFVAFRHFVDRELKTICGALGMDAPNLDPYENQARAMWKRYSDNYERATNPERVNIQARSEDDERQASDSGSSRASQSGDVRGNTRFPLENGLFAAVWDDIMAVKELAEDQYSRPMSDYLRFSPYSPCTLREKGMPHAPDAFVDLLASTKTNVEIPSIPKIGWRGQSTEAYIEELDRLGLLDKPLEARLSDDWRRFKAIPDFQPLASAPSLLRCGVDTPFGFRLIHVNDAGCAAEADSDVYAARQSEEGRQMLKAANSQESGHDSSWDSELAQYQHSIGRATPAPESNIVGRMIRTERIRLPDGSIRTRKVFVTRFADGREESGEEESNEMPHASSEYRVVPVGKKLSPLAAAIEEEKQKKGRNWFWAD